MAKKKMSLPEMVQQVDVKFVELYKQYAQHHKDLQPYANRELSEEEVKIANGILEKIQDSFKEIYALFNYIQERYQLAIKATEEFVTFKKGIQGAGAEPVTLEATPIETNPATPSATQDKGVN